MSVDLRSLVVTPADSRRAVGTVIIADASARTMTFQGHVTSDIEIGTDGTAVITVTAARQPAPPIRPAVPHAIGGRAR